MANAVGKPTSVYLHAEIAALVKCRDWGKIHRMSIFRFNSKGNPMLAKPCDICQHAINLAGIDNVEHT